MIADIDDSRAIEYEASVFIRDAYFNVPIDVESRLLYFSTLFIGSNYQLNPLGEGVAGELDQFPLFRIDAFDCQTFIETVLSLVWADCFESFFEWKHKITYCFNPCQYHYRSHFLCCDWLKAFLVCGWITNITKTFSVVMPHDSLATSTVLIDKLAWFKEFKVSNVRRLDDCSNDEKSNLIAAMHKSIIDISSEESRFMYYAAELLLRMNADQQKLFYSLLPQVCLVMIIKPAEAQKSLPLPQPHLRHCGFIIKKESRLYFRHASKTLCSVVDEPLFEYLAFYQREVGNSGWVFYRVNHAVLD